MTSDAEFIANYLANPHPMEQAFDFARKHADKTPAQRLKLAVEEGVMTEDDVKEWSKTEAAMEEIGIDKIMRLAGATESN